MPQSEPVQVDSTEIAEKELTAQQYWTEDRKAKAVPIPLPKLPNKFKPNARQGRKAGAPAGGESAGPDGEADAASIRPCFKTTRVNDMSRFPYQAAGKLFMRFGQSNYVGSAWVVGESTIATAGHCVHEGDGGAWADSVLFEGRYDGGSSIGSWSVLRLAAPRGWTRETDYEHDMAFGITASPIRPNMGKLGWMANYPPNQGPYTEIGYPGSPLPGYPFDGKRMWQSVGDYVGGSTIVQACGNMTPGCSGGPWTVQLEGDWRGNGTNSHRYGNPERIYSPYFGDNFINLIDWMGENDGD